ncbi:MAG: helix-turn-helix transcriptional regulator [Acidaminococcaceae bacterium]|nr:helix-turn-helix transcriptional regulator [Acidaminococcaceae bacterium]
MSNNIKAIRMAKGINQKDLASMVGVSGPYIHDLENEARGAKRETLEKIAAALGVTIDELIGKAG